MPHKKIQVPSKNQLTIQQKISQLFESLQYETEISDPSNLLPHDSSQDQSRIPIYVDKRGTEERNYLFSGISIPSPDPDSSKNDLQKSSSSPRTKPETSVSQPQVSGFYSDRNNSGPSSVPFTLAGKKFLGSNGFSPVESSSTEEYFLMNPFTSLATGKNVQLFVELGFDKSRNGLGESDKVLLDSVLNYLLAILEHSI
jgi:hypothetical protein